MLDIAMAAFMATYSFMYSASTKHTNATTIRWALEGFAIRGDDLGHLTSVLDSCLVTLISPTSITHKSKHISGYEFKPIS